MKRTTVAIIVLLVIAIMTALLTIIAIRFTPISSKIVSAPIDTSDPLQISSPLQTGGPLQSAGPLMPAMPLQNTSPLPIDDTSLEQMTLGNLGAPADIPFAGWEWYDGDTYVTLIESVLASPTAEGLAAAVTMVTSNPTTSLPYSPSGGGSGGQLPPVFNVPPQQQQSPN